jgi:WD40 repeat protein/DNA-binding SARP family transcriptional activator
MSAEFRILGPIEVAVDDGVIKLGGPKQRAVLTILLLQANRVVPIEQLVDDLYNGNAPPTAAGQVRDHVSQLRKLLATREHTSDDSILETRLPGYLLRVAPEQVDSVRFDAIAGRAFAALDLGDAATASDLLRDALALWRGPPLADFLYWPFAQPTITRLEAHRLRAIERRIEADLLLGREGQLVGELEELVSRYPLREQLRAHLMLALYRSGRQAEALQVYHETRKLLGDELGIEASAPLRQLAVMLLRQEPSLDAAAASPTSAGPIRNPYKGLRPFEEADADDYFGRETASRQLLERLVEDRFVAVVGPSGSGKSSLVLAGLVPALRAGAVPESERWRIAVMKPGAHPLEELEASLLRVAVNPPPSLMEQLESPDDRGLCRSVKRVLHADNSELVLIVDQFEELFTLVPDDGLRSRFLTLVERAVSDPGSRLRVVVTLRADHYDRPLSHRTFGELLQDRVLTVLPLVPEEIDRAVSTPASRVGVSLEQGLVAEIVADVIDEPGVLPLLQYALTELFERREDAVLTRSAYRSIGGVSGALAARADALYATLSEPGKAAAKQFFLQLVAVAEDGAGIGRRIDVVDLASLEVDQNALAACIDAFDSSRLLSFDRNPRTGAATVALAHEALLTRWGRLHGWVESTRDNLRMHRRLAVRVAEWEGGSCDTSFLLRGSELARFEVWSAESDLAQSDVERAFLRASRNERDAAVAEEASRLSRQQALERRAFRRLRALVAVLAIAALLAAGLTAYAFGQRDSAQQQARIASAHQLAASSVANLAVDPELSILLARQAVEAARVHGAPLVDAVDALHRAVAASRTVLTIPTAATAAIAVSPDGSRIATAGSTGIGQTLFQQIEPTGAAIEAVVWSAATGRRLLRLVGAKSPIQDIAYSSNGSQIATGTDDGRATIWDAATGKRLFSLPDPNTGGGYLGVAFRPVGAMLATADSLGRVRIWNLKSRRLVRTIDAGVPVCGIAWNREGTLIGAGQCAAYNLSLASAAMVWDARSGRREFKTEGVPAGLMLRFAPDSRHLVTPTQSDTAEIWDYRARRLVATLTGHTGQIDAIAYSPDGKLVATGATDGTARIWDARTGTQRLLLAGHDAAVTAVEFTPNGRRLVTAGEDGTVRIWDITPQGSRDWLTILADPQGVNSVAFEGSRQLLSTGACDGKTKLWNANTGALIWATSRRPTFPNCPRHSTGQPSYPAAAASNPNNTIIAQPAADGSVQLLDGRGNLLRTLLGGHLGVQSIVFDGTGNRIATGNWDGTAIVWNAATGQKLQTFAARDGPIESVGFSPDGRTLATAGDDTIAKVWDIHTGLRLLSLTGHTAALTDVEFSPDGTRLATSSEDGSVRIYVLPVKELLAVARRRLTRTWTIAECRAYLPGGACPAHA